MTLEVAYFLSYQEILSPKRARTSLLLPHLILLLMQETNDTGLPLVAKLELQVKVLGELSKEFLPLNLQAQVAPHRR